jgi:hypothetical protein
MMSTVDGYWDSWDGTWRRWRTRHTRTVRLSIPGEPIKKGDRRARQREAEIREHVAHELRMFKRSTLTGPVALSLHLDPTRNEPPDLPKLAKFLLDVLGTRKAAKGSEPSLYRDDSQVKMLHVSWHPTDNDASSASTRVLARPLRDVIEDLRLAHEIDLAANDLDIRDDPFASEAVYEEDWSDDADLDFLPAELRESLRRFNRTHRQRFLLQHTGVLLRRNLAAAPEWIADARPRRPRNDFGSPRLREIWADLDEGNDKAWTALISQPLTIPMPSLPVRSGEDDFFRTDLDAQLAEFSGRWPIMVPLEEPLNVTILVVPPVYSRKITASGRRPEKDLDNLALAVMPPLRRVFGPPTPSKLAITSYQVIQLARKPSDPPAGYLRVVLGTEIRFRSDWDWIADYVDEHADEELD